jgi:hypothetical protein
VRANGNFISSTFTLVSSVPITLDWNRTSVIDPQRLQQIGALRQPAAHGLAGDVHAVTVEDRLLRVQGMIRSLGHNHLRQHAGPGRALLDRLRRLVAVFTMQAQAYFLQISSMTISFAGMYS